jgi:hypothetical protein
MEVIGETVLAKTVLGLVNRVRTEAGDEPLKFLPRGSIKNSERGCPLARALVAVILPKERRIAFCYEWYAVAATKIWRVPFTDALLLSVAMPDPLYEFAIAFRSGAFPELVEFPE